MHGLAAYSYVKKQKEWTGEQWLEWEFITFKHHFSNCQEKTYIDRYDHKCDAIWIDKNGRVR
jgi:hypothetical protein